MKRFEGSRGRVAAAFFSAILAVFLLSPALGQGSVPSAAKPITNAVAGGSKTTAGKHPWLVAITFNGFPHCSGALVHPRMVLTAVSCVWNSDFGASWGDMGNLQAFTGRSKGLTGGQELEIDDWGGAEKYRPETGENDWALIGLKSPSSRPVLKIAGPGERALWKAGQAATLAGFDQGPKSDPNNQLKQVKLPILRDSACGTAAFHGSIFRVASMICAGAVKARAGACWSDRGSPLIVPVDGGGRRIVGVASRVGDCAGPEKPTIFTRVAEPRLSTPINELATQIGQHLMFTGSEADTNLLGAGGQQVGCKAAGKAGRKATKQIAILEKRLTTVSGKSRKKTAKALKKAKKLQTRSKKRVKRFCN